MPRKNGAKPHPFGAYLRAAREEAGVGLNYLARELGLSSAYLSEVERGIRGPLIERHWPILLREVPGMDAQELQRLARMSGRLDVDMRALRPPVASALVTVVEAAERGKISDVKARRLEQNFKK